MLPLKANAVNAFYATTNLFRLKGKRILLAASHSKAAAFRGLGRVNADSLSMFVFVSGAVGSVMSAIEKTKNEREITKNKAGVMEEVMEEEQIMYANKKCSER